MLGGKRAAVESGVSRASGLDPAGTAKVLAALAPVVMGALGKARRENGLDASKLSAMLGQESNALQQKAPQAMGALSSLLDSDGDGDVDLGDLVKKSGVLGKLFG